MSKNIKLICLFLVTLSYSSFAQTNYNYITDFIDTIPPNTKEIITWHSELTEEGDTTILKAETWKYDKNKNLTFWYEFDQFSLPFWSEPRIHCGIEKKYDKQNRIIFLDKYCTETGSSQTIFISYSTKNTVVEWLSSLSYYKLTKTSFDYNSKKKVIRKEVYDSTYYTLYDTKYKIERYVTVYKYDKNDNLIEENTFDLPNLTTKETTKYAYNKYNQILRKETNEKQNDGSFNTSIIKYNYYGYLHKGETKPKLFNLNRTRISDYSTESCIEEYTYYQKNVIEIETTQTSTYGDETSKETYQLIYKDNKLIRKKYFSKPRKERGSKVISWIDYQYIFY